MVIKHTGYQYRSRKERDTNVPLQFSNHTRYGERSSCTGFRSISRTRGHKGLEPKFRAVQPAIMLQKLRPQRWRHVAPLKAWSPSKREPVSLCSATILCLSSRTSEHQPGPSATSKTQSTPSQNSIHPPHSWRGIDDRVKEHCLLHKKLM